jgi:hypothetical protein
MAARTMAHLGPDARSLQRLVPGQQIPADVVVSADSFWLRVHRCPRAADRTAGTIRKPTCPHRPRTARQRRDAPRPLRSHVVPVSRSRTARRASLRASGPDRLKRTSSRRWRRSARSRFAESVSAVHAESGSRLPRASAEVRNGDEARSPRRTSAGWGGWKNPDTVLTCGQTADEVTMRAVLASRRPLRAAGQSTQPRLMPIRSAGPTYGFRLATSFRR